MALRICMLVAFAFIYVGGEELFERCAGGDVECMKRQPITFLSKTHAGYPKLGIEPIDPLIVTSAEFSFDNDLGFSFHFKNMNITGFKNSKLEYRPDETKDNHEIQTMQADLTISSDVEIVLTKTKKTFRGTFSANPTVVGTSVFGTGSVTGADGKQYFVIGPETTSCEIRSLPSLSLGNELRSVLNRDEDAVKIRHDWPANVTAQRAKLLCGIADYGFATFFRNLRALSKALDRSAFFTD